MTNRAGKPFDTKWLGNPGRIIIGLLLLHAVFLFIPGSALQRGVRVLYWQRYNNYLYQLRCLIFILVPIAIALSFILWQRQIRSVSLITDLVPALILFFFCLFLNYASLFVLSGVTPLGTTKLNEQVYHLARYAKYDDPTIYYLGECDQSGFRCVFQEIYWTFNIDAGRPEITASNDGQQIIVKMDGNIVYTYDGKEGHCSQGESFVLCYESFP